MGSFATLAFWSTSHPVTPSAARGEDDPGVAELAEHDSNDAAMDIDEPKSNFDIVEANICGAAAMGGKDDDICMSDGQPPQESERSAQQVSTEDNSPVSVASLQDGGPIAASPSDPHRLRPCIIHMDSAKLHHPQAIFRYVRSYLQVKDFLPCAQLC